MFGHTLTTRRNRRDWGRGCLWGGVVLSMSICHNASAQQVANFFGDPDTDPVTGITFNLTGLPLTSLDFDGAVVPLPPEGNLTLCARPGAYRVVLGEEFDATLTPASPLPANRFALFISDLEFGSITLHVNGEEVGPSDFDLAVLLSPGDLEYSYEFTTGVLRPTSVGDTTTHNGIAILYGTSSRPVTSIRLVSDGLRAPRDYVGVAFGLREGLCVDPTVLACAPCDFAVDGILDCYDWETFTRAFFAGDPRADINGDESVDVSDFFEFIQCFALAPGCQHPPTPPNARCSGAIDIAEFGLYDFYNCTAFTDTDVPKGCSSSTESTMRGAVWYCWTNVLSVPAQVCVSTLGTTSIDTVIAVYDGCTPCDPAPETVLGCNDDAMGGRQSFVSFEAQPGQQYMIQIGTHNPPTDNANAILGSGFFRVSSPVACPCDFNCFGGVDSQDFFDFLTAFFAGDPRADLNMRDGINSQDFFDFLTCFFTPPEYCTG